MKNPLALLLTIAFVLISGGCISLGIPLTGQSDSVKILLDATATQVPTATLLPTATVQPTVTKTPNKRFMPFISNDTGLWVPSDKPPLASTSYYLLTVDSTKLYNIGCEVGKLDLALPNSRDTVVVLDFGSPVIINSQYGTDLFWFADVNMSQIASAAENFGKGYYVCVGADRASHLYIGIGTTNYGTKFTTTNWREHGTAWAKMVNEVNSWFKTNGYSGQVHAVGAIDIELSWNSPINSRAWVDGYDSVNLYDYYNFGTLDGCAYTYQSTYCSNGWTRIDALYTSFGPLPAFPLPEIYRNDGVNAKQWAMLSVFSVSYYGVPMDFVGVFTQWKACQQSSPDQCIDLGLDNTPAEAWLQLYTELAKNPATAQSPRWSTDIKWWDNLAFDPILPTSNIALADSSTDLAQDRINQVNRYLQQTSLSEKAREFALAKLESAYRIQADRAEGYRTAASKQAKSAAMPKQIQDPAFKEGIFDGMGGPIPAWEALITNHWQAKVNGGYRLVSAGVSASDEQVGVVVVVDVNDERVLKSRRLIPAPQKTGKLTITAATTEGIWLIGEDGSHWLFDPVSGKIINK